MPATFKSGDKDADFEPPENFPTLIETAADWAPFQQFKRRLASHFSLSDFGTDKLEDGSYILFPLDQQQASQKKLPTDLESFLSSFSVFSELSPKAAELIELVLSPKKKFAESGDFTKVTRLALMKLVGQLVVFRREVLKQEAYSTIINTSSVPLTAMGDLESSSKKVSLKEALDFFVQQALSILGAHRMYEDLLAHWSGQVPAEERQARDQSGAAPFWSAQQDRFLEYTSQLRKWPDFGTADQMKASPAKDSLLWYGMEALTDTRVKFQERQTSIKHAYHTAFKQQRKHASLAHEALRESSSPKRPRFDRPVAALPQAPKPSSAAPKTPPPLMTQRSAFSPGVFRSGPKNRRRGFGSRPPLKCSRCNKIGHSISTCRMP